MSALGFPSRVEDLTPELMTAVLREQSPHVAVRDVQVGEFNAIVQETLGEHVKRPDEETE